MTGVADSIIQVIATSLQLKAPQVTRTVELLESGNTVPFIARYRKEITGALDEDQIRTIQERYAYASELEARKVTVLETIEAVGKLTAELRDRITRCYDKAGAGGRLPALSPQTPHQSQHCPRQGTGAAGHHHPHRRCHHHQPQRCRPTLCQCRGRCIDCPRSFGRGRAYHRRARR